MALGAIIARAGEFQPLNIALTAWGLAKLSYKADVAFESLCVAAAAMMDRFVPQNLVQTVWACATSGYRNDDFLQAVGRVAKRTIKEFSSQHLSNFLWACARLGYREDRELLRVVSEESIRKMNEGSPQHLSNIAWAVSQLGPDNFPGCLESVVKVTSARLHDFDAPSLMMLSDSLFEAKYGEGRREPLLDMLRKRVLQMGAELFTIFTQYLPPQRGVATSSQIAEYQRSLRSMGLVTYGYEHTNDLFAKLHLLTGTGWNAKDAATLPGWTSNARRTTVARQYVLQVGTDTLDDPGTIFTSAFASAAEDASCDFIVTWLGQGKADSPNVGRAGRSGDAECRAILDTHHFLRREMQTKGATRVTGSIAFHSSGVPCLSCVGVAAQFQRCYPELHICFTFVQREQGWDSPDVVAALKGQSLLRRLCQPAHLMTCNFLVSSQPWV